MTTHLLKTYLFLQVSLLGTCLLAQDSTPTPPPAPSPDPKAAPTWSVGSIEFSGYVDGYYGFNANRPSNAANGQVNDFYAFNDKTDQFNLNAAKFTLNHDADPVGVRVDLFVGRTNTLFHSPADLINANYIEQAYISVKPPKTHGTELDFGQFVTSAGAEVTEAKDNWNYSRALLFANIQPYYHFGLRTTTPITPTWTAGVQIVNGWNNVTANNGGVTVGLTSLVTKPKFGWALNYYTGPQNADTQKGYRNLIDTTVTLTPTPKFSAYINYDYVVNHLPAPPSSQVVSKHLSGIAVAGHASISEKSSLSGRYEFFNDNSGFSTGTVQKMKEFTATYEYKWAAGLLSRVEYRRDWSNQSVYHKGDTELVKAQSTLTVAFIAFFGPKR